MLCFGNEPNLSGGKIKHIFRVKRKREYTYVRHKSFLGEMSTGTTLDRSIDISPAISGYKIHWMIAFNFSKSIPKIFLYQDKKNVLRTTFAYILHRNLYQVHIFFLFIFSLMSSYYFLHTINFKSKLFRPSSSSLNITLDGINYSWFWIRQLLFKTIFRRPNFEMPTYILTNFWSVQKNQPFRNWDAGTMCFFVF